MAAESTCRHGCLKQELILATQPVMPSMLGRDRAGSEPRGIQQEMSHGVEGRSRQQIPDSFEQPGTRPLFVPPGLAPQAIGASVEDGVVGPRHSALGLEGMEAEYQAAGMPSHAPSHGRGRSESHGHSSGLNMKASTVRPVPNRRTWYA
jgi:hypothetical protein